ncbi:amyloid beta A4 precursor protein-binding family B member 1-interacting protein-like isoform X1 [Watersipora subatra]|uniref:amyloid beta A4 precursor protein-binding family B member 1-interacting protein-like isoform X1 n=1 Tax=Watersipora subatra TaxID=2589382 RepID=UPI00355AE678
MDSTMCTSMEVEYDSDEDLQDVGNELNSWLSQLDTSATQADERGKSAVKMNNKALITQSHTMESFRCSVLLDMDNGGNPGDLDDIINDLCALEAELADAQKEYHTKQPATDGDSGNVDDMHSPLSQSVDKSVAASPTYIPPPSFHAIKVGAQSPYPTYNLNSIPPIDAGPPMSRTKLTLSVKQASTKAVTEPKQKDSSTSSTDKDQRAKEEKIRIAIQKIKAADIKKLFVKVFIQNGECKTILVDEKMAVSQVLVMLYDKCEVKPNVRWTLIEQIPDLFIERIIEDHEKLISVMMNWQKISNNKILFLETDDKYDLFFQPQKYLLSRERADKCVEKEQRALLNELFGGAGTPVPEMEGEVYHKVDGQKSWKKITVVLRTSGLYMKKGKSTRNLLCLTSFEQVEIYRGFGWRKKYKAPTEHCFALKHPKLQKKSKDIRYFCCEDEYTLKKWLMGMRVAKYGKELHYGFKNILEVVGGTRKASPSSVDTPSDSMSQSSRDSGFSVTSDSSNSLDITHSSVKKHQRNGVVPPPPDEFCDLPLPPPELLAEDPTPTNTPVHFAQINEDFNAMRMQRCGSEDGECSSKSSNSSSSISNVTPRNSLGTPTNNFERCSGIRSSLHRKPSTPKLVAPPKIPEKTTTQMSPAHSMHSQSQVQPHRYGHYSSQCHPPPVQASSLSVSIPSTDHQSKGSFLSELNSLYAQNGRPLPLASSESDSDVDELPPPPPELLSPQLNGGTQYDASYSQIEPVYSVPPPPLDYNPYADRRFYEGNHTNTHLHGPTSSQQEGNHTNTHLHGPTSSQQESYSMSRVFASQTGTIKRAPQPPKRNNSISTMRNGNVR